MSDFAHTLPDTLHIADVPGESFGTAMGTSVSHSRR